MAHKGKKYREAAAKVERRPYTLEDAISVVKESVLRQVRRDGRSLDATRRQPASRRPDGPRHRGAAARHRQDPTSARGVRRSGAEGGRGGRRRRRARGRRCDREDPGRLARVRRHGGHPGHDADAVEGRAGARSSGSDAEPEVGNGDPGHRRSGQGDQGRAGRVPGRQAPPSSTRRSARSRSRASICSRTPALWSMRSRRRSRPRPRGATCTPYTSARRWVPECRWTSSAST